MEMISEVWWSLISHNLRHVLFKYSQSSKAPQTFYFVLVVEFFTRDCENNIEVMAKKGTRNEEEEEEEARNEIKWKI